jgi:hypothetical protein
VRLREEVTNSLATGGCTAVFIIGAVCVLDETRAWTNGAVKCGDGRKPKGTDALVLNGLVLCSVAEGGSSSWEAGRALSGPSGGQSLNVVSITLERRCPG